jgi:hypothetical protein
MSQPFGTSGMLDALQHYANGEITSQKQKQ